MDGEKGSPCFLGNPKVILRQSSNPVIFKIRAYISLALRKYFSVNLDEDCLWLSSQMLRRLVACILFKLEMNVFILPFSREAILGSYLWQGVTFGALHLLVTDKRTLQQKSCGTTRH